MSTESTLVAPEGGEVRPTRADHIRRFHAEGCVLIRLHALGDTLPNGASATGKEPVGRGWQKSTTSPPLEECLTFVNYGILPGPSKRGVLDVEPAGLEAFPRERLPKDALVVSTPSGGYHAHLDLDATERVLGKLNKKIKLGAKAELHSLGSQVLGPGSRAYSDKAKREGDYAIEQDGAPISDESALRILLAPFLEQEVAGSADKNGKTHQHVPRRRATSAVIPAQHAEAWATAALTGELEAIASAPAGAGQAHATMMSSGARLGQIVGAGLLDRDSVLEQLVAAATQAGWDEREARRCAHDAVEFGSKSPRGPAEIPEVEIVNSAAAKPPKEIALEQASRLPQPPAKPSSPSPSKTRWLHRTDIGNAERLVAHHRDDLFYCDARGGWHVWDEKRYKPDATGKVELKAKKVVRSIFQEAAEINDPVECEKHIKHALGSEKDARIKAMLARARVEEPFACAADDLDSDDWLLNVQNGTLDLRTGELRPHRREDRITKLARVIYNPSARCDDWEAYLDLVTGRDKELQSWMQRFAGYCLTGDTSEDRVPIFHGPGGTGKSSYLEIQKSLLGDYAMTLSWEVLLQKQHGGGGGPRDEIARLAGARLVIASEVEADRHFNAGLLKSLSGGDTIAARFLYKGTFEFRPTFKLLLAANDLPHTRPGDSGSWRRLLVVPFTHRFPETREGRKQRARLRQSDARSAELAWAMRGLADWRVNGLGTCSAIERATAAYRSEEALVDRFLVERCVLEPEASAPSAKLYEAFVAYLKDVAPDRAPMNVTRFGRELSDRGLLPFDGSWGGVKAAGRRGVRLR